MRKQPEDNRGEKKWEEQDDEREEEEDKEQVGKMKIKREAGRGEEISSPVCAWESLFFITSPGSLLQLCLHRLSCSSVV